MCNNESSFIKTLEIILEICYNNTISFKVSKKEIICLLSKLNSKQHIEIYLDMDELDLTDAEKKATD